jgi:hypothetical protein
MKSFYDGGYGVYVAAVRSFCESSVIVLATGKNSKFKICIAVRFLFESGRIRDDEGTLTMNEVSLASSVRQ